MQAQENPCPGQAGRGDDDSEQRTHELIEEKLPFLMRVPVTAFGVAMGLSSQAMVWRTLVAEPTSNHLYISIDIPSIIGGFWWLIGLATLLLTCLAFALKILFYPQEVKMELNHPVRSNYFAGPFLASLFLLMGTPSFVRRKIVIHLKEALAVTIPLALLEVYLYGHWIMMKTGRSLSEVVNPTTQVAVVGNFMGATAFGLAGSRDLALFMFALGAIHQLVIFVTAYANLSSASMMSNPELYPYHFLFVAPPCAASLGWSAIQGNDDGDVSKLLIFSGLKSAHYDKGSEVFLGMVGVYISECSCSHRHAGLCPQR